MDMLFFASVVGFAAFLVSAFVFVGLGTSPNALPTWVQTVFIIVGTLIALAKYNFDRFQRREDALAEELIAASRMSGAIQRVMTRTRHIRTWMEIRDEVQTGSDPLQVKQDKLDRVDQKLEFLQDQVRGKKPGDVVAPAAQEIGEFVGSLRPVRASRILKCKRAIEDFQASVFAADESLSPNIAFYDHEVYSKMDQVKHQGILAIDQIKAIEDSAPEWLVAE